MKTYIPKIKEIERKWYLIDAKDKTLGRLASKIAFILIGKHKPIYTPNFDCGDYVIVINASKIKLTGNKLKKKIYYRHSLYPNGLKAMNYEKFLKTSPEKVIEKAVKNMLPDGRLGRKIFKKLKVYKDSSHPHQSQNPEVLKI